MAFRQDIIDMANAHRTSFFVTYASATGNAQSIAKRVHGLLHLETPFEPFNKYSVPEANDDDKKSMTTVKDAPFDNFLNYEGGISLNGAPVHFLLMVVSTTGNGDIPENGDRFYRKLKRLSRRNNYLQLRGLAFSTLALGDTNYSNFCAAGKSVRSLFLDMGAREMMPFAAADDATGMEEVVEKWVVDVKASFPRDSGLGTLGSQQSELSHSNTSTKESTSTNYNFIGDSFTIEATEEQERGWDLDFISTYFKKIFDSEQFSYLEWVDVKRTKLLTSSGASKVVLHFEVDIEKHPPFQQYLPGDAIGIFPANDDRDVEKLLELLNFSIEEARTTVVKPRKEDSEVPEHILFPNSIYTVFKNFLDISDVVTVEQISTLVRYCKDDQERRLLSSWILPNNMTQYKIQIHNTRTSIIDLLERFPSCKPPIAALLQILSPQRPRYYSISSSPLVYPKEIHFAFNVVEYTIPNTKKTKYGLCTSFLKNISTTLNEKGGTIRIPMFMKATPEFRLPEGEDKYRPIIMIGPGTGVTPFRSFVQHRVSQDPKQGLSTKNWLIHGCQKTTTDFLYQNEFKEFESNKNLTLLVVSSQEAEHGWIKTYFVQDMIYEYASQIVSLMEEQHGYLYMCGDASKIYTHISNAIRYILHEELNISIPEAEEKMRQWKKEKRFQVDAW